MIELLSGSVHYRPVRVSSECVEEDVWELGLEYIVGTLVCVLAKLREEVCVLAKSPTPQNTEGE
jgi:hypothetical protein